MSSINKGKCYFKGLGDTTTVGDVFELSCRWLSDIPLSDPVRVELQPEVASQKQAYNPYSLVILNVVSLEKGHGVFKVTSYKPGNYHVGIKLISDTGSVEFLPVRWTVESVIPIGQESVQPYPPYGPWVTPLPIWYWFIAGGIILLMLIFVSLRLRALLKRRNWIATIRQRRENHEPFHQFINKLIGLERKMSKTSSKQFVNELKNIFTVFLEEELYVPFSDLNIKKSIKQLKKYRPNIYKKHHTMLYRFLSDLSYEEDGGLKKGFDRSDCEQLINTGRDLGIKIFGGH